jgi:hypothetical protein
MKLRTCQIFAAWLAFQLASAQVGAATVLQAGSIAWTLSNEPALRGLFKDAESTEEFLREVVHVNTNDEPQVKVGDCRFAQLTGDESEQLLCTLSDGSRFYPTLVVIRNESRKFHYDEISTGGALDMPMLAKVVVELDPSGARGLLIPRLMGPYQGARPTPVAFDLYAYRGGKLVNVNGQYPEYYRQILLPQLKNELSKEISVSPLRNAGGESLRQERITALRETIEGIEAKLQAQ